MISVYPAGKAKTFVFDFKDENDNDIVPTSGSYSLLDELDTLILADIALTISVGQKKVSIPITANDNTLTDQKRGFRTLILTLQDAGSNEYQFEQHYVLESTGIVEKGKNSFASYGSLIIECQNLPELETFLGATISDQRAALINAWYSIGDVPLINLGLEEDYLSTELSPELIDALTPLIRGQLLRAQLIEANFILGGNPVEDRRRIGMISDSSGESAQFFRTSRPAELPICKAAANALRGLVSWNLRIAR